MIECRAKSFSDEVSIFCCFQKTIVFNERKGGESIKFDISFYTMSKKHFEYYNRIQITIVYNIIFIIILNFDKYITVIYTWLQILL